MQSLFDLRQSHQLRTAPRPPERKKLLRQPLPKTYRYSAFSDSARAMSSVNGTCLPPEPSCSGSRQRP